MSETPAWRSGLGYFLLVMFGLAVLALVGFGAKFAWLAMTDKGLSGGMRVVMALVAVFVLFMPGRVAFAMLRRRMGGGAAQAAGQSASCCAQRPMMMRVVIPVLWLVVASDVTWNSFHARNAVAHPWLLPVLAWVCAVIFTVQAVRPRRCAL